MSVRSAVSRYLVERTDEAWRAIQDAVVTHPDHSTSPRSLLQLAALHKAGDPGAVLRHIGRWYEALALSPLMHSIHARALLATGNDRGGEIERWFAGHVLERILTSGKGTRESPLVVLRTSDEYQVMHAKGVRNPTQSTELRGKVLLDHLRASDDDPGVWFRFHTPKEQQ